MASATASPLHQGDKDSEPRISEGLSDSTSPPERSINYILEQIPAGKFHYRLLLICGLSFMADAMVCLIFCLYSALYLIVMMSPNRKFRCCLLWLRVSD